jgi:uncharacterized integral membrane protein
MTMARKVKIGLAAFLLILLLILVFQNMGAATTPIRVRLFFWSVGLAPILLLPFVFLVGTLVGYVLRRR